MCFQVPLPPKHQSTSSCPPASPLSSTTAGQPKLSLDSEFLDPDELAAKGATLLHHLAVWMIQQKNAGVPVGKRLMRLLYLLYFCRLYSSVAQKDLTKVLSPRKTLSKLPMSC